MKISVKILSNVKESLAKISGSVTDYAEFMTLEIHRDEKRQKNQK